MASCLLALKLCWLTESHSGRYRCSVTDHPGSQRQGQEVQVSVEGENTVQGGNMNQQIEQLAALLVFLLFCGAGC